MPINNYHNYQISYLNKKYKSLKESYHVKLFYALHRLATSINFICS